MKEFVDRPDDPVTQVFSTASPRFSAVPPGDR